MARKLENKDLMEFRFSMVDDDQNRGVFTGYASVFGAVDSYGDVVMPGAFKKTLKETNPVPMLWNHSVDQPIGVVLLKEEERGLKAEGHLNLDVVRAQEIRSLMKQGSVRGLSIGFQTVKEDINKDTGSRQLKEIKLWEVSPVVFQACPGATVSAVKSEDVFDDGVAEPVEAKPYPNEHACRLRDPGDFQPDSFKRTTRKHEGKEYSVIMGKLNDESTMTEQAYRYAKDAWSSSEAKAHCADHDGSFEAAKAAERCDHCGASIEESKSEPAPATRQDDISEPDALHLLDLLKLTKGE